jgi:hypothetical protein
MGTEQLTAVPVQPVAVYVTPSLYRIDTVFPVIAEPPFAGATQFIITLLPEIAVVGAEGAEGTDAGSIAPFPAKE